MLAATDIVDVIGAHLELKHAGTGRHKALCPFHTEKTPSFTVSQDRQMFYCFGCEQSGDAIDFLREYEGLTFVEALQKLADRSGVRLPARDAGENSQDRLRRSLHEFNDFAAAFFRESLADALCGGPGRQYLKGRGLSDETMERFGLGYVPEGWSNLADAALKKGFPREVLEASGMVKPGPRGLYDLFRNRVMFPIRDVTGRTVAFGGRALSDDGPKYINSPESPAYRKSRVLYGLHESRDGFRTARQAVLVEGYFDLLRCFDAGIENVVATCGTALTTEQARLIHRYAREVILVFDGDPAGLRAALRGVSILVGAELTVRAVALPGGRDPDDFVRESGPGPFRDLLERAPDFVTFYVGASGDRLATIEGRAEVARELFAILREVSEPLRRDEYLKRMARALRLNEWSLRSEFEKSIRARPRGRRAETEEKPAKAFSQDDIEVLAVLLNSEVLCARCRETVGDRKLPESALSAVLVPLLKGGPEEVQACVGSGPARDLYAAAATTEPAAGERAEELVDKRVTRLVRDALVEEVRQVQEALKKAEERKETSEVMTLCSRVLSLRTEIDRIGAA